MEVRLQIFILCRDRPEFSFEAISSVLRSAKASTEVIVSDNSESEEIRDLVERNFPTVSYRRRYPTLAAIEHFQSVIEEASAEYLVISHDDDRMLPSYVVEMLSLMEVNPDVSAIGCNGEIIRQDGTPTGRRFMNDQQPLVQSVQSGRQFLAPYLSGNIGAPPFPAYCYRRKFLKSDMLNFSHGGKHSDVTFLLKVLRAAPMIWYSKPLIQYRDHSANDSKKESVPDRLSFLRYIFTYEGIDRHSADVVFYKFGYWLAWWRQRENKGETFRIPRGRRERVVFKFLAYTAIKWSLTGTFFWRVLIRKSLRKLRVINDQY